INVYGPDGTNYQGSSQDLSFIYAPDSPLPGGGNGVVAVVADVAGTYAIEVTGGADTYVIEASAFGAGLEEELTKAANKQTLFIDFDGETINAPALFGSGNNPAVLSPLVDFLPGWGLTAADEDAVIDAILKSIEESVKTDLASVAGVAGRFNVEILNSRDHADPGNANNTSRLIVGGSIAELGISTIGIAEFIDPGNYGTNDTAVTLLDLLSAGSTNPNSLNQFPLGNGATIIDLIGTGVGNITAHEAGHFLGLFHTDQFNGTPNIQDQGGNLANSVGVGPNGIYETPIDNFKAHGHSHAKSAPGGDDVDVDFLDDVYVSNEGLRGIEQSAPTVAYGLFSNDPLPVEYTAFTATAIDQDVLLAWTTGTEVDNAGFFVEQLQDGRFIELGFVEGVGNSVEAVDYRYTISDLLPGTHTFRLKQVDFNGEFAYSAEVEATVEVPGGYLITEAYPNPFNPLATFTLGVSAEQNVRVELYNATGQLVSTIHNGELSANTMHTFRIDGADLPSGLYLYRAVGESFVTNAQRVLLVK
ncbi:MAG: T9SS type A sorting domain-containing protein, partial [Bacteroidota bacterium]